jgi:hypothetical protein
MHQMCYYRIDNIEVEPQLATRWEIEARTILGTVARASHAELDQIMLQHFRIRLGGRREVLVQRRATTVSLLEGRIYNLRRNEENRVRRERFIGPLTIQMANGHPF